MKGSKWQHFEPTSDKPLKGRPGAPADDPVRTDDASRQLARMLTACIAARRGCVEKREDDEPRPTASRFGLLGGLGQGKTSALNRALEEVKRSLDSPCGCWWRSRRPNVASFDAAKELPAQLEFEFDRLLAAHSFHLLVIRTIGQYLVWILYIAAIALVAWYVLHTLGLKLPGEWWEKWPHWVTRIPPTTLLSLPLIPVVLKTMTVWSRRRERLFLFDTPPELRRGWWEKFVGFLDEKWATALAIFTPLDLVVVDNLDRASIPQQRALLRAIYKHQDDVPVPIVVAFDETALLHSGQADPEAPEHLLAKAIEVTVRLPDRQPVEALSLARLAIASLPQPEWRQALDQPEVEHALAEVLLGSGPWSPRTAKRLLNDSCVLLAQVATVLRIDKSTPEADTAETLSILEGIPLATRARQLLPALFRLQGLWQLCPALRAQPQRLSLALECPDGIRLAALRVALADPRADVRWESFLLSTRHLRLAGYEWSSLVAAAGVQAFHAHDSSKAAPTLENPAARGTPAYRLLDTLWWSVDSVRAGQREAAARERGGLLPAGREGGPDDEHLLSLLLGILTLWSAMQQDRTRAMATLETFLRATAGKGHWTAGIANQAVFRRGLLAVLLARAAATGRSPAPARIRDWLDWGGIASPRERLYYLMLLDASALNWLDLWLLLPPPAAASGATGDGVPISPTALCCWCRALAPISAQALADRSNELTLALTQLAPSAQTLILELLGHWPALVPGTSDEILAANTRFFRKLVVDNVAGAAVWPEAMETAWRDGVAGPAALVALVENPDSPAMEAWDPALGKALIEGDRSPSFAPDAPSWDARQTAAAGDGNAVAALFLLRAMGGMDALERFRERCSGLHEFQWPADPKWLELVHDALQTGIAPPEGGPPEAPWEALAANKPELVAWIRSQVISRVDSTDSIVDGPGFQLLQGRKITRRRFGSPPSGDDACPV
ncbi:MAG TPA: hypothetical protein VFF03_05545 [Rhodocyclaceae bacterium]|nr:hypothetical protein [Rhodocyclaceae bacterium]